MGKKKAKEEYLEKIRPFFVIENVRMLDLNQIKIKQIYVEDDSSDDVKPDQIVYHWSSLLLSNQSEFVCMFSYIKINGIEYASFDNIPIKSGDFCEIKGFPLSAFIRKTVDNTSIGFLDRFFNLYEYKVNFEIKEFENISEGLKKYCHKSIMFSRIDCRINLADRGGKKVQTTDKQALS